MATDRYLAELFSLDGRVAVVTGGSSGIGRAIAEALASAGASVVLVARGRTALDETVDALAARGASAASVSADLGDRDAVRAAARSAAEPFGAPDILVNCAGVNLRPPMQELDDRSWDATMAVNLHAPYLLGQLLAPGMAERGYGRIINISSQQAHRAFLDSGAYGVSKGGLEALTRSQAEAWSPRGVTSNALAPGVVLTPLNARLASDERRQASLAARTMIGRNGEPEDFAGAAVSSPAARRPTSRVRRSSSTAACRCTERARADAACGHGREDATRSAGRRRPACGRARRRSTPRSRTSVTSRSPARAGWVVRGRARGPGRTYIRHRRAGGRRRRRARRPPDGAGLRDRRRRL